MKKGTEGPGDRLRRTGPLVVLCLSLALSLLLLEGTRQVARKEHYTCMLDAAQRMEAALEAVRAGRLAAGIPISYEDDPGGSGLVGLPYSDITTSLGSLEAKRSSINPNMAAMVVDMLVRCGVGKGDAVAVNFSSSFPALNIAVLCALDATGAEGVVITSVGASTYGANIPNYTYLDMENLLLEQKLVGTGSSAFSLGGAGDLGREMPEDVKAAIVARHSAAGLRFLAYEDLGENIRARQEIYNQKGAPACFINVGGNLLAFGGGPELASSENGIIRSAPAGRAARGLVPIYRNMGVPVIHLLNLRNLAERFGLPYAPCAVPSPGEGEVYFTTAYRPALAAVLLVLNLILLLPLWRERAARQKARFPVWKP